MKVSVVIPVFNEEDFIGPCLEALQNQTTKADQIVVVDNNSTDRTAEIAHSYDAEVLHEPRQGIVFARNRGFNASRHQVIGRIDADTRVEPGWVARLKKDFSNPHVAAIGGSTFYYDQPNRERVLRFDIAFRTRLNKALHKYAFFLQGFNCGIRQSVWQELYPKLCTDPVMHEDLDLAIHLKQLGYGIKFDKQLIVGASSRTLEKSLRQFFLYSNRSIYTFKKHRLPVGKMRIFLVLQLVTQLPLRAMQLFYLWRKKPEI